MIKKIKIKKKSYVLNINNPSAEKTVIFNHGFLSNKNKPFIKVSASALAKEGIKTVRFNYHTELMSQRLIILKGVIDYLSENTNLIGLVGSSLGGMTVILTASDQRVKSLALINTVYDPRSAYENYQKKHPVLSKLISKAVTKEFLEYNLEDKVKKLHKPVLVISGSADEVIPQVQQKKLYQQLKGHKRFMNLEGCTHAVWKLKHVRKVKQAITKWFKQTLNPSPALG